MQLRITGPRAEALRYALDIAYLDQQEYIQNGHPERDYQEEWTEAARHKAELLRHLADIAERIGYEAQASAYRALSREVLNHANYHARRRAQLQERTQRKPTTRDWDREEAPAACYSQENS